MDGRYLNIDTDALRTSGQEISDLAEETRALVNRVRNDVESMSSYWTGTDAAEFVTMALENSDKTNKLLESFAGAGAGISTTADNYKEKSDEYIGSIRDTHYDEKY